MVLNTVNSLRRVVSNTRSLEIAPGDVLASTLAVFRTVLDLRRSHGVDAIGLYIISMSRSAADALAVLALARVAGCVEDGIVPLDVSPLFETVDDLKAAPAVMQSLFEDPAYRAHLAARGDEQTVMLGYSDSTKESGALAAACAALAVQATGIGAPADAQRSEQDAEAAEQLQSYMEESLALSQGSVDPPGAATAIPVSTRWARPDSRSRQDRP